MSQLRTLSEIRFFLKTGLERVVINRDTLVAWEKELFEVACAVATVHDKAVRMQRNVPVLNDNVVINAELDRWVDDGGPLPITDTECRAY